MKFQKVYNKGQARIFRSPYLEMLTKTHPLLIAAMYLPLIAALLYYSATYIGLATSRILLLFFVGMISWSLFEYLMHRFVFHYLTESAVGRRLIYILHGNHHEYPRDKQRLFMPPVPSVLIAGVLFSLFKAGMGSNALVFFPGFLFGYLIYGSMHFAIHAWNPPFKWMKPLWRNHHLHHYKDEAKGFGVSSTLWDHVFGTMFDLKKEKENKEKVRELMFSSASED